MSPQAITVDLVDDAGVPGAAIVISELPGVRGLVRRDDHTLALREGSTLHYRVHDLAGGVHLEPSEMFDADGASKTHGRIRTAQYIGRIVVTVDALASGRRLHGSLSVAPTKLHQIQYRQMLEDIADHASEMVLQGFAPATVDLAPSDATAELLYQRFAILEARLQSEDFTSAMGRVLHQPHRAWEIDVEIRTARAGYPTGSAFGRALAAPGPRQLWPAGPRPGLATLPRNLPLARHETTVDTAANRFVKFALERWRGLALQLLDVLDRPTAQANSGPVRRGREAAQAVVSQLDELLGHYIFREVGRLQSLPTSSQVLLKREGYRQLFRTFALVEAGPALSFRDQVDDVYSASQRNVATLYEFWCYLVLAQSLGEVCGESKIAQAFVRGGDGMSLTLQAGRQSAITWAVERHGRRMEVALYFNRSFSVVPRAGTLDGSWSREMRPDCSVHVRPLSGLPSRASRGDLDVWIHFDAKYRVDRLVEQLEEQPGREAEQAAAEEQTETHGSSKREDLLKMHAYRDAIHRTAGAYVLYPGSENIRVKQFAELLPGLGAFALRPDAGGSARGAEGLRLFLADVLSHCAQQATRHERDRFWSTAIHSASPPSPSSDAVTFLDRPPADTDVLIGFVRAGQQAWVERTRLYNVRADDRRGALRLGSRELGANLLLLYNRDGRVTLARTGTWLASDNADLLDAGYPQPGGHLYFVAEIAPVPGQPAWLDDVDLDGLRPLGVAPYAPFVVTWFDLLVNATRHRDQ